MRGENFEINYTPFNWLLWTIMFTALAWFWEFFYLIGRMPPSEHIGLQFSQKFATLVGTIEAEHDWLTNSKQELMKFPARTILAVYLDKSVESLQPQ